MPCTVPARGTRQSAPHTGPPFNDATDNTPCGRRIISTANGVNYAADSLCLFHLIAKYGQGVISPPYVDAA